MGLPIEVVHGAKPGPRLWLSAAVHGDELNGVEIIRRVLEKIEIEKLRGAIIAAPVVNAFGFINQSRYLPDRRDLNRSFPGSKSGSLASRLAHLFLKEVVSGSTHGIDLHTAANHRTNLPQIRANLQDAETLRIAKAFSPPIIIDASDRSGSLREAASRRGIPVLLFEGGEPLRFNPDVIRAGVSGVLRVMDELGMRKMKRTVRRAEPIHARTTTWVRARRGGILRLEVAIGDWVHRKQEVGVIADTFGSDPVKVVAPDDGLIIGHTLNPLVHQGDSIMHVAVDIERPVEMEHPDMRSGL